MAKSTYRLRRLHRFLGVSVGIQLLFWTISGLYFSWTNLDDVHGDPQKKETPMLPFPADTFPGPGAALAQLEREAGSFHLSDLRLIAILGKPCWQITYMTAQDHHHKKTRLAEAFTGLLRAPLSEAEAVEMAKAAFNGNNPVEKVEYLTEVNGHHEFRDDPLPAYAVTFDHPTHTTVYVSTERGTVQKFRNDQWRMFDWLWMMHTMDYRTRDDINNVVLRVFSVLGLLTVGSGFLLFFRTLRRRRR